MTRGLVLLGIASGFQVCPGPPRMRPLGVAKMPVEAEKWTIAMTGVDEIVLETGRLGRQAEAAVMVRQGDTMVYTTLCLGNSDGGGDWVPMSVEYQERHSASGRTSNAINRRDGRPMDKEILIARLIDRPLRPTIIDGWLTDVQIVSCVVSFDGKHSPDVLAMLGASAALALSRVPTICTVGASRVAKVDDELVVDVGIEKDTNLSMVVAAAAEDDSVLMVEGGANFEDESTVIEALKLASEAARKLGSEIQQWADDLRARGLARPKFDDQTKVRPYPKHLEPLIEASFGDRIRDSMRALELGDMTDHREFLTAMEKDVEAFVLALEDEETIKADATRILKKMCERAMVERIRGEGRRCDGRSLDEVRPIDVDQAPLPTAHGSAVFTRGETQSLATCTLGGKGMALRSFDALDEVSEDRRFYLQYSFPPSSVGETGRIGAPGRREVGHGALAERALEPAVPAAPDFAYSIRVESLITESCGSSSMASVCGGALAMMDAGVPIKTHVAGVAMGLVLPETEDDDPILLTDILGIEDALGSMDFKVAGDDAGISAFQLDVKRLGLTPAILADAVQRSRVARLHVIDVMKTAVPGPRSGLAPTVPRQHKISIAPNAIGKLIGPGGRTVRAVIDEFGLRDIQCDDDGTVYVSGLNDTAIQLAADYVTSLVNGGDADSGGGIGQPKYDGPLPELGTILAGTVTDVKTFGVFVALEDFPGLEGLCHISELAVERVRTIERFIQPGADLKVKVMNVNNETKKLSLSRKEVLLQDLRSRNKNKKRTTATSPPPKKSQQASPPASVSSEATTKAPPPHPAAAPVEI